jgi:outer membrane lipoprotein-sorting protein
VRRHQVQRPLMPAVVKDANADQLVRVVNEQSEKVRSLTASVTIQLTVGGERKGNVSNYTSINGYILLQAPNMVRVQGLFPLVQLTAFDLASDGTRFSLLIPSQSKAYTGSDSVTKPSSNPLENLRPDIFYDGLILREIAPGDLVSLTQESKTRVDEATHHLMFVPGYELTIVRRKRDSQEIIPERRVHFDRTTLLPNEVDVFNDFGAIQTQTVYGPYVTFGDQLYPSTITIRRPIDEYQIVLSVQKLTQNQHLNADRFELKIPPDYVVHETH